MQHRGKKKTMEYVKEKLRHREQDAKVLGNNRKKETVISEEKMTGHFP